MPLFRNNKASKKPLLLFIILFIAIGIVSWWFFIRDDKADQSQPSSSTTQKTEENEAEEPVYKPIDLQSIVLGWVKDQPADYSIVIHDLKAKKNIAEYQQDQVLFAASLYKIYVAYLSLVDFQTGAQDPNEIISQGRTKKECVDAMIRSSDSPCGEAMMAVMGPTALNLRVKDMGMTGTFFNGIRTTAHDSALILKYIAEQRDLNDANTALLRDAMQKQDPMYKRGLQSGAPEAKWETKVGWNLDINYHDIGIMTMPDGREFTVAILGQGSGRSAPIADFATTIYSALN